MSETKKMCTCGTCGYEWQHGLSGHHYCTEYLTKERDRLRAKVEKLSRPIYVRATIGDDCTVSRIEAVEVAPSNSVGQWVSVGESMPDDEISVLVWSRDLEEACMCHHDSEVLEKRGDSGWILAGSSRVILGVSHWCGDILEPAQEWVESSTEEGLMDVPRAEQTTGT